MPDLASFYSTFSASVHSVGTAVTLAAVGVYLHRREFVSSEGKRTLAKISQQVTFPLFLFTKIIYCNQNWSTEECPDVTKSLRDVWILLLWPLVVVGVGCLVGYGAAIVSGCPKSQFRSVLAACGFGNSTGLPITLLTVVHTNFPETSDLGHIDPCLFLSVYLLLYPVLQWGIGGWLLAQEGDSDDGDIHQSVQISTVNGDMKMTDCEASGINDDETEQEKALHDKLYHSYNRNVLNNKDKEKWYKLSRNAMEETDASLYISDADLVGMFDKHRDTSTPDQLPLPPHNPGGYGSGRAFASSLSPNADEDRKTFGATTNSTPGEASSLNDPVHETTGLLAVGETNYTGRRDSTRSLATQYEGESFCETCELIMSRCFQPPVIGALLGIFVAATPLRGIFVDLVDRGSHAPLQFFFDGLYHVGIAAVPINMMILGCNLSASYSSQPKKPTTEVPGEPRKPSNLLSTRTLIAIVIGKMLIMPLIGIGLALFLEKFVLDIPDEIDGAFYLVLMIVFITPTANNVMVMVELSGSNTKEGIAQAIAIQYACAPIMLSLTMSLVVGIATSWD